MKLKELSKGIYINNYVLKSIEPRLLDAIIFDCDGVLVDVSNSYNCTIIKTAQHVLDEQHIPDYTALLESNTIYDIIDNFKATGQFNNEIDLTYAILLSLVSAKRLNQSPESLLPDVYIHANSGISGVSSYLEERVDISDIQSYLAYPSDSSVLLHTFDQLFYGPELYKKRYGIESKFTDDGFINRDGVILDYSLLDTLSYTIDNIALVTGRGYEAAYYSLGEMLKRFDLEHSFFLEDHPRSLAKPNPDTLLESVFGMGSEYPIYVGDSIEDVDMARETDLENLFFCGVYGSNNNPEQRFKMLKQAGVDMLINSIHDIPNILYRLREIRGRWY